MADKKDKKSTSPGPHGMKETRVMSKTIHIGRGKPIKKESRAILLPIQKREHKYFSKKPLKERSSSGEGRTPKARKLTSLMRKGYRKGYRVKSTRGGSRR
jgi:hypothetical protein